MIIRYYWHNRTYGGNEFVDYDTEKNVFWTGNTASTKRGCDYNIALMADTLKSVRGLETLLKARGVEFGGRE